MLKTLKWIGTGLVVLLAVLGALWSLSRWMGPTEEQKQALAVLAQKDVPEGRNAFPAIWLLEHDVPEDQLEAVTAEDVARFADAPLPGAGGEADAVSFVSVAEERFPRLVEKKSDPLRCQLNTDDCLAKVRAQPRVYAKWRKDNARLISRVEALSEYGHYQSTFVPRIDMPFPAFSPLLSIPTARAVDFVDGHADLAVDGICRDIGMYRQLGKGADSLIVSMIAFAGIRGGSRLLADMLQELPADFVLPRSCARALQAPVAAELSLCNAMRGEAAFARSGVYLAEAKVRSESGWLYKSLLPLLYDRDGLGAMLAPVYAWPCMQDAVDGFMHDSPSRPDFPTASFSRFECVGNIAGCMLADIGSPAYENYFLRSLDTNAQLKLISTVFWLRARHDDKRPLAERLASRPDELKSPTRDIQVVDDGRALSVRMFEARQGLPAEYKLPLPHYLQDAANLN